MNPRISVVTATRNVGLTLPALYESLVAQDYGDFEWIVADGDSTDDTVSLLREFSGRSPWLHFISEPDFGIYDALNRAIRRSTGDYYLVMGADDVLAPQALTQFAQIAVRGKADVVLAHVRRGNRVIGGFRPDRAWVGPSKVFAGSHSVGTLIRRQLHDRFGYYSHRFPLLADAYFLKRALRSGDARFVDAEFIAGTFAEGGATTSNELQLLAENWQIQMLTERHTLFQVMLFLGKILVRFRRLSSELSRSRVFAGSSRRIKT